MLDGERGSERLSDRGFSGLQPGVARRGL